MLVKQNRTIMREQFIESKENFMEIGNSCGQIFRKVKDDELKTKNRIQ